MVQLHIIRCIDREFSIKSSYTHLLKLCMHDLLIFFFLHSLQTGVGLEFSHCRGQSEGVNEHRCRIGGAKKCDEMQIPIN
jgi:hypothetical protein